MEKEKKAFYDLAEIKAIPLQEICRAPGDPGEAEGKQRLVFHSARTGAKL